MQIKQRQSVGLLFYIFIFLGIIYAADIFASNIQHNTMLKSFSDSNFQPPQKLDLTDLSWAQAFEKMHAKISKEYAFSAWNGIDWNSMYSTYHPMIVAAEQNLDEGAYYQALLGYISSLHDTHAQIMPSNLHSLDVINALLQKNIGGSDGLIITHVDDGRYIISYIASNGAASLAQLQLGAEIVAWNNQPIENAVNNASIIWAGVVNGIPSWSPATRAGINYEKLRFLTRGTIGSRAVVTFKNPNSSTTQTVILTAIDDKWDTINRTCLYNDYINDPNIDNAVRYSILPSGYGYIRVLIQAYSTDNEKDSVSYKKFAAAIKEFNEKKVPGVILDLRGNLGSGYALAFDLIGFFYDHFQFFANYLMYNTISGNFEAYPAQPQFIISPQDFYYGGQVVVLTDIGTVSSGEAVVYALQKLPTVHVLSFYPNTMGSLSDNQDVSDGSPLVLLPPKSSNKTGDNLSAYNLRYGISYIVDRKGRIMINADKNFQGGVKTDLKIPLDTQTAIDIYTNRKDPALNFAQNCLATQCWKNNHAGSDSSNFTAIGIATAVGISSLVGGIYYSH
jgi:carboxyl-terminal processing protease